MKKVKSNYKSKKGFTLIELLAVIVILAIIAAIAVPAVLNIVEDSKREAFKASVQSVMRSVNNYDFLNGDEKDSYYSLTEGKINVLELKGVTVENETVSMDKALNDTTGYIRKTNGLLVSAVFYNDKYCNYYSIEEDKFLIEEFTTSASCVSKSSANFNDLLLREIIVAEGALTETHGILQKMNELSVKAANDTNTSSDIASIMDELIELQDRIDRIYNETSFQNEKVLQEDNMFNEIVDLLKYTINSEGLDVKQRTTPDFKDYMKRIEAAINKVSEQRSIFGAYQNSLEYSKSLESCADEACKRALYTKVLSRAQELHVQALMATNTEIDKKALIIEANTLFKRNLDEIANSVNDSSLKFSATGLTIIDINNITDDKITANKVILDKLVGKELNLDDMDSYKRNLISAIKIMEGALTETHSILQRMNELSVKAANGNSNSDINSIMEEMVALQDEIDRIYNETTFNSIQVLKIGNSIDKELGLLKYTFTSSALGVRTNGTPNFVTYIDTINSAINKVNEQRSILGDKQGKLEKELSE